jgi:hypothetical protein
MKRSIRIAAFLAISMFAAHSVHSQCVPDTSCKDINLPGEICPGRLSDATVNMEYNEVITVIPPSQYTAGELTLTIAYIILDSVVNLPEGITYQANATTMYADSLYCISITGTPVTAGEYPLTIYIYPWLSGGGTIFPAPFQVKNDTSVVMTVNEAAGVDPNRYNEFQVLPNIPNPFSEVTRIGFFTPYDDRMELEVYNILGELMHQENYGSPPGEHYFEFDGEDLLPGTYIYRVTNHSEVFTGKFIKARK